jgi:hypothetical protein
MHNIIVFLHCFVSFFFTELVMRYIRKTVAEPLEQDHHTYSSKDGIQISEAYTLDVTRGHNKKDLI